MTFFYKLKAPFQYAREHVESLQKSYPRVFDARNGVRSTPLARLGLSSIAPVNQMEEL